jgi:dimethylglycine dehydrogenase
LVSRTDHDSINYDRSSKTSGPDPAGGNRLDWLVDFAKPNSPRAAALTGATGPKRRFVVMEVEARDADVVGYESIMKEGNAVGYVTSGAYGHCVDKSLAAGYVPTALAREGERFEIDVLGETCAATVRLEPLHDPRGLRLRA